MPGIFVESKQLSQSTGSKTSGCFCFFFSGKGIIVNSLFYQIHLNVIASSHAKLKPGSSSANASTVICLQELGAAHRENEHAVLLPGFGPDVGSDADGEWTLQLIKSALVAGFLTSLFSMWKAELKLLNIFIHIRTWNLCMQTLQNCWKFGEGRL